MIHTLIIFAATGMVSYHAKKYWEWDTKKVMTIRKIHKYLSIVFWLGSNIAMNSGIRFHVHYNLENPEDWKFLPYLNIILMSGIVIVFEGWYQYSWRQEDQFIYDKPLISEQEFEERIKNGEKLVILDNMVIDISTYAYNHPGGAFLLDYNVGRDISKFFYGSYALDGNANDPSKQETERYAHSNIARKIANNNRVGKMKYDGVRWSLKSQSPTFKINQEKSVKINDYTLTF